MEPIENVYRPREKMVLDNFLGGIAWSLGTLVGATVIIGIIGFLLSRVDLIPVIGSWLSRIVETSNITNAIRTR